MASSRSKKQAHRTRPSSHPVRSSALTPILSIVALVLIALLVYTVMSAPSAPGKAPIVSSGPGRVPAQADTPVGSALPRASGGAVVVDATVVEDLSCAQCVHGDSLVVELRNSTGIEVRSVSRVASGSDEGRALVAKAGIKKVPVVVVKGDPARLASLLPGYVVLKDGTGMARETDAAPYTDAAGKVHGVISPIIINDARCPFCIDLRDWVKGLTGNGLVFSSVRSFDASDAEAVSLMARYNITRVPAAIFSADADLYPALKVHWPVYARVAADGTYVYQQNDAPYVELATGVVTGKVGLTSLVDATCAACYDVSAHKNSLSLYGFQGYAPDITLDISSAQGKALVQKYAITTVPTIILTGDVGSYARLKQPWAAVGTIEADGAYVFRNQSAMQAPYEDLVSGAVVGP